MNLRYPCWLALESMPTQCAVLAGWRPLLGDALLPFSSAFFRRKPDFVRHVPCPYGPPGIGCGCMHEVVHTADGDILGLCRCEPPRCEDRLLTPEDITPWELSWSRLGRALCQGLSLSDRTGDFGLHNTRQIGSWSTSAVPVILTVQTQCASFASAVAHLVARLRQPFILLAPTNQFLKAPLLELLANVHAAFFDLASHIRLDENGNLHCDTDPRQLFQALGPAEESKSENDKSKIAKMPQYALIKGLGFWKLIFDGQEAEIRHERGIFYVAYLLTHPPEQPIHALDLMAKIPEIYRHQLGLPQIADPATGKTEQLQSHARIQERSLALDDAQALRALLRKQRELEALLDSNDESEPVKAEALRELEAITEFQCQSADRTRDSGRRAAHAVQSAIGRFHRRLTAALGQDGAAHPVLRAFAEHIQKHILIPSARYTGKGGRARTGLAGCFVYEAPEGVRWAG